MNEDRTFERAPAGASPELRDRVSPFNRDVGPRLFKQSTGKKNLATTITLGQRVRQIEPHLSSCSPIDGGEVGRKQKGGFFQPKACRHNEVGKQRVANAVAITGSGACSAIRHKAFEADVPKYPVVIERDKADICSTCSRLIGVVACRNLCSPAAASSPPNGAVRERRFGDQAFVNTPAIEAIETGDSSIPGRRRDALAGLGPATNSMVGEDVATVTLPYGLAAGFRKKADPDEDIIAVCTKGVP